MSYTFVLNSRDKISGSNNSATYNILFSRLAREYKYYSVSFTFTTDPAFFTDTYDTVGNVNITYSSETGHIRTNLLSQTSINTANSPSTVLGIIVRNFNTLNTTTTNNICYLYANDTMNQDVVVLRPELDQITIDLFVNSGDTPLVSTNTLGVLQADSPPYILIMKFTPIKEFPTN